MSKNKIDIMNSGTAIFWCPGCDEPHGVWIENPNELTNAKWDWNKSLTSPTFKPSIFVNAPGQYHNPAQPSCHSFVTNGEIRFLSDCSHDLAGKTVPLPPVDEW